MCYERLHRVLVVVVVLIGALGSQNAPARQGESSGPLPEGLAKNASMRGETGLGVPEGSEILTRGPVHEAFAEPVVFDPEPGPVVPKALPDAIEEMPPDQKPKGEEVVWISGYWAWDEERQDFLWISGIWRDLPPGRQWVPGYWAEVQGGSQWISGYWAPIEQDQADYLSAPPATLESGPNVPSPSQSHVWTPGYWYWYEQRYVWRPGCWIMAPAEWVWAPPPYVWCPSGYVFVPGYWDYAIDNRGMLFAPVYFPQVVYVQPAFIYTPAVVIQTTVLMDHFFCRPAYHHYYFGDYYGVAYRNAGFFFGLSFNRTRCGYDPIFAQYAVVQRGISISWERTVWERYEYRVAHVEARPARTFATQAAWLGGQTPAEHRVAIASSLADVAQARADVVGARAGMVAAGRDAQARGAAARVGLASTRLEQINQGQREQMAQRAKLLSEYRAGRQRTELELAKTQRARVEAGAAAASQRAGALGDIRQAGVQVKAEQAQRDAAARQAALTRRTMPKSPMAGRAIPRQIPGGLKIAQAGQPAAAAGSVAPPAEPQRAAPPQGIGSWRPKAPLTAPGGSPAARPLARRSGPTSQPEQPKPARAAIPGAPVPSPRGARVVRGPSTLKAEQPSGAGAVPLPETLVPAPTPGGRTRRQPSGLVRDAQPGIVQGPGITKGAAPGPVQPFSGLRRGYAPGQPFTAGPDAQGFSPKSGPQGQPQGQGPKPSGRPTREEIQERIRDRAAQMRAASRT